MTFSEAEDLFDNNALLDINGRLYKYSSTAAEVIRRINIRAFEDIETGEEIGITYLELRDNPKYKAVYT